MEIKQNVVSCLGQIKCGADSNVTFVPEKDNRTTLLILSAPITQNGQTRSNNLLATADNWQQTTLSVFDHLCVCVCVCVCVWVGGGVGGEGAGGVTFKGLNCLLPK